MGASTGGFTDCLLQHGAARVLAIDTGYGQIAQKLRSDARVSLLERTNARHLQPGDLPEGISLIVMDVSFISATLVLPGVVAGAFGEPAAPGRELVVLVKPQFEAGREFVGKGGIVREAAGHELAVARVRDCLIGIGGREVEWIDSPILGMEGNREFLMHAWIGMDRKRESAG
jgi:23S rRNA (cytidine1920-2'-O)/16S rRNA (cytidine1409-2'-O)-methyltransferase